MSDTAPVRMHRSRGTAQVALSSEWRVGRLVRQGYATVTRPRCHGHMPVNSVLDPAGGEAGGDRPVHRGDIAPGARQGRCDADMIWAGAACPDGTSPVTVHHPIR